MDEASWRVVKPNSVFHKDNEAMLKKTAQLGALTVEKKKGPQLEDSPP